MFDAAEVEYNTRLVTPIHSFVDVLYAQRRDRRACHLVLHRLFCNLHTLLSQHHPCTHRRITSPLPGMTMEASDPCIPDLGSHHISGTYFHEAMNITSKNDLTVSDSAFHSSAVSGCLLFVHSYNPTLSHKGFAEARIQMFHGPLDVISMRFVIRVPGYPGRSGRPVRDAMERPKYQLLVHLG